MIPALRTTMPQAPQFFSRTAEALHQLERNSGHTLHVVTDARES
jgi:hypothetical protein